ncbi:DUF4394 domain-containing protein [Microcoleus sp. FACHB-1515]|uniref:DUF4394 domain-containing protein n=1 Tax=Cyanophyceae TaxID=3028117 RepID=UPI001689F56D|nr:DUF4394 domain-containing protein [Microcoleus sp. FACHB-1515]MBD2091288.1 DUF4394 domain-containing protein [Microcoleus sp. FACHB-1515]
MTQNAASLFAQATRVRFQSNQLKLQGSLTETNEFDLYQFDLTQSRTVQVALNRIEGNSELVLYDRRGRIVANSDEADGEAESILERLKKGRYFLEVRRIEGDFRYRLNASNTTSTTEIERQGSSFERAIEIEQNGSEILSGRITLREDVDFTSRSNRSEFYKFTVVDRTSFSSTLKKLSADCEFALYGSDRQVLFTSDQRGNRSESISQVLESGVYYLEIRVKRSETRFKLNLDFQQVQLNGNSIETAESIEITSTEQTISGLIGASDTNDCYQVDVTSTGTLKLSLSQLSVDANLEVINSSGTVIATSANLSTSQEFLNVNVTTGIYYVRVSSTSTTFTQYEFNYQFESFTQSIETAVLIQSDSTTSNAIAANEQDWYRVDLDVASRLDLQLDGLSADADLQLFDANGNLIDSSLNSGTTPDAVFNNLNPGTYYVRVFLADGAASTNYRLSYSLKELPLYALADNNRLVALDPNLIEPGKLLAFVDMSGLAAGETMTAIDFRPGTGELYGLSSADKLYTINLTTGAATQVGVGSVDTTGFSPGFDFDPSIDRLRFVSETGENQQIDPLTGAIVSTDGELLYSFVDANAGFVPSVTASAYSNNVAGSSATALYGIDTDRDVLVLQNDQGDLFTVGGLGVDFDRATGFDILTDANGVNRGYAASNDTVYSIDLATGAATAVTPIVDSGNGVPYRLIGMAGQPV